MKDTNKIKSFLKENPNSSQHPQYTCKASHLSNLIFAHLTFLSFCSGQTGLPACSLGTVSSVFWREFQTRAWLFSDFPEVSAWMLLHQTCLPWTFNQNNTPLLSQPGPWHSILFICSILHSTCHYPDFTLAFIGTKHKLFAGMQLDNL